MRKERSDRFRQAAVVSIHDVMPETLPRVQEILRLLERMAVHPATLLVVPGRKWPQKDIACVKSLQRSGCDLAGHGWRHRAGQKTSSWHRLHGLLLSRNEAEHLSLPPQEIAGKIRACYNWFGDTGLALPSLYVPPAWAMGPMPRQLLADLPFRLFETQWGVYDAFAGVSVPMPLAGYMADTPLRSGVLRISNLCNRRLFPGPLRIAIHPQDLRLAMARDVERDLSRTRRFLRYSDIA